jgi:hypothetical protein
MKNLNLKFWIVLVLTCAIGFILAKVDTSKNWDDTAVTVGLVLISSFSLGLILPRFAWLWAIILSTFIFVFNVIETNNYQSAGAVLFAFAGAYCGVLFTKFVLQPPSK